jgi:GNAT superfamily N-acetyltransferase
VKTRHGEYRITDEGPVDFAKVHDWLTNSYWSPGITREKVEQAAKYSAAVVSVWHLADGANQQVGYCRVVSDRTRFAWLADVFVEPAHRNRGIARAIVRFCLDHPELRDVPHFLLGTKDAHGVYAGVGFKALDRPESFMQLRRKP